MDWDDYFERLQRMLQDVGEFLQPDDLATFLNQAVLVYSKDRPLIKIKELTGDGSSFDFSIPDDWIQDFSYINSEMQYPADDTIQDIPTVDRNNWQFIRKLVSGETTLFIRFKSFIPANGKKVRFEYVTKHTLDLTTNTIKDTDQAAVLNQAAALCYWALAARFAQNSDSTIEADVIDYARKSEIYQSLAIEKQNMYKSLMGIGVKGQSTAAASAGVSVRDLDMQYPGNVGDYLTHSSLDR